MTNNNFNNNLRYLIGLSDGKMCFLGMRIVIQGGQVTSGASEIVSIYIK